MARCFNVNIFRFRLLDFDAIKLYTMPVQRDQGQQRKRKAEDRTARVSLANLRVLSSSKVTQVPARNPMKGASKKGAGRKGGGRKGSDTDGTVVGSLRLWNHVIGDVEV